MKNYFIKKLLGILTIMCLLPYSNPIFAQAQWISSNNFSALNAATYNETIKVTSTGGSVGGGNIVRGDAMNSTGDILDPAGYGGIPNAFNVVPSAELFKATAGKPFTITLEFDLGNLVFGEAESSTITILQSGLGKNEQNFAYDQYITIAQTSLVTDTQNNRRKYTFTGTYVFPSARSQAWLVFGFKRTYGGVNSQYSTSNIIVLPFMVDGVKEPNVPLILNDSGQPRIITQPSLPVTVLHAPPGDQSFSKFEINKTSCQRVENSITESLANTGTGSVKLGFKGSVGFVATIDVEAYVELTASVTAGSSNVRIKNTETCISSTTGFGASPGSGEDIFVCEGLDFNYAVYDLLVIDPSNFSTSVKKGLAMVPVDNSKRLNFFTRSDIINEINTRALDTLNSSLSLKERIDAKNQLNVWKQLIAINDANVANATIPNPDYGLINLSGGAPYLDRTTSVSTNQTNTIIVDNYIEGNVGLQAVVNIGGSGFSLGYNLRTSKSYGQTNSATSSVTTTMTMHLEDNDAGDLLRINIYRDPMFGTPLFKLQSGSKTSSPFEGGYQRDQPSLRFSAAPASSSYTVPNVAVGQPSIFGINLCNNSNEQRTYNLRFNPLSNGNGASISISGTTGNTEFGSFIINPNACAASTFFVSITQGNPAALSSPDLNLELYPANDQKIKSDIFATCNWGNYALPTGISTGQSTICQGANSNVTLSATCAVGTTPTWYNALSGGAAIGTGSPLLLSPSVSSNYFVSCNSGPYNYKIFPANTVIVNPAPAPFSIFADGPLAFCNGGSVTLKSVSASNNNALTFTRANSQYVTVPHSASLNLGTNFTVEAWVNYSGQNVTIVDKGNYDFLWSLNPNTNQNKMGFYNRNTGTWAYSTGIVPQNTWTHVAITLQNDILVFYINGVASGTASVTFSQDTEAMNIGRQQPTACACNHFNGTMDELRLWNLARTQSQIQANMNSVPTNTTGLVAYYKFDEGTGSTTADATSNNNNGTLVNAPTWQVPSTVPYNVITALWTPNNTTASSIYTTTSGTYTATVTNGFGCSNSASSVVSVGSNAALVTLVSPGDDFSSGTILRTASSTNGKISATNKIIGTSKVTYNAKSIELNAGFNANSGTVFLAEVGGCN